VLVKFTEPGGDPTIKGGRYMVHCHNLPHEDHDMMAQFAVGNVNFATDPHHGRAPQARHHLTPTRSTDEPRDCHPPSRALGGPARPCAGCPTDRLAWSSTPGRG